MAAVVTGGIAYIKIDGNQYYLRGQAKIKPQSFKQAVITNQDGSKVVTRAATAPMISANFSDYNKLSITALQNINGSTIILGLVNGKSYTLVNAVYVDETELNTEDGAFAVNFSGSTCNELVSTT